MNPLSQPTGLASGNTNLHSPWRLLLFLGVRNSRSGLRRIRLCRFTHLSSPRNEEIEAIGPPLGPLILVEGDVIGEIQVPRLGLDAIVVQGDSPANLRRAVGHLSKSALPGEWGNVTLAGHRDTFFRPLRDIRLGDEIVFKTPERQFDYLVESIEVVTPNDIQVLEPSTGHDLTFITCSPFHFVGPAPKRFVVRAREVDRNAESLLPVRNRAQTK